MPEKYRDFDTNVSSDTKRLQPDFEDDDIYDFVRERNELHKLSSHVGPKNLKEFGNVQKLDSNIDHFGNLKIDKNMRNIILLVVFLIVVYLIYIWWFKKETGGNSEIEYQRFYFV
jgi:hypothetical protein